MLTAGVNFGGDYISNSGIDVNTLANQVSRGNLEVIAAAGLSGVEFLARPFPDGGLRKLLRGAGALAAGYLLYINNPNLGVAADYLTPQNVVLGLYGLKNLISVFFGKEI